ncbi:class I SAM-dependent methyltransferase [Fulvivirga sp. 29W222]|uniref:Class I SAM-dependent methyltransferase n=1 Tax=Fulvivirga marina TaxID=2494733 RepID=A0A937G3X2_9BACT|nr:class I SAM-dependent methyltransferase [Fulvivirga marina]MBL6449558.1 class I SAM-dependent methyltransferase [Fulvivirga marina]
MKNQPYTSKETMDKSEKFWDKSANGYDKEEMKDKAGRMKILDSTKKYLQKKDDVLDFGCATGILANEIARDVHTVHGMDISSEMVRIAQNKANELNLKNVKYTHGTLFDDCYKPGTFDTILAVYMLHLMEDMPKVLNRIHSLLKPGGLFISVTPCLGRKTFVGIALSLVSKIGLIPNLKTYNVNEVEDAIVNAGFSLVESECLNKAGKQYFIVGKKD